MVLNIVSGVSSPLRESVANMEGETDNLISRTSILQIELQQFSPGATIGFFAIAHLLQRAGSETYTSHSKIEFQLQG